jgi:Ca-activated chloride channel homolog
LSVPVLGPMTSAGFAHGRYFLFLLVILGLLGFYVVLQIARQRGVLRFANLELLESVAPTRSGGRAAGAERRDGRTDR